MKNMVFLMHRELKGMPQVKLASQLGICKDYVNMLENNRRMPGFSLAKRIADLFGITVDHLFFVHIKNKTCNDYRKMLDDVV